MITFHKGDKVKLRPDLLANGLYKDYAWRNDTFLVTRVDEHRLWLEDGSWLPAKEMCKALNKSVIEVLNKDI